MLARILYVACSIPDACENTEEGNDALVDETVAVGLGGIVLRPTKPFGERLLVQSLTPSP